MIAEFRVALPLQHTFTGMFKDNALGVMRFTPASPVFKNRFVTEHIMGTYPFGSALKLF